MMGRWQQTAGKARCHCLQWHAALVHPQQAADSAHAGQVEAQLRASATQPLLLQG